MCPPIPQFCLTASGTIPEEDKCRAVTPQRALQLAEAVPQGPPQPEMLSWYSPGWVSPGHSLPLFQAVNGKFTPPL